MSKKTDALPGLIASIAGIAVASYGLSMHSIIARHLIVNAAPPVSILISGSLSYFLNIIFYNLNKKHLNDKLSQIDNQLSSGNLDAKTTAELKNMRYDTVVHIVKNFNRLIIEEKDDIN
jgi:hypothetical protein